MMMVLVATGWRVHTRHQVCMDGFTGIVPFFPEGKPSSLSWAFMLPVLFLSPMRLPRALSTS